VGEGSPLSSSSGTCCMKIRSGLYLGIDGGAAGRFPMEVSMGEDMR
jgi:hypothetical protein